MSSCKEMTIAVLRRDSKNPAAADDAAAAADT